MSVIRSKVTSAIATKNTIKTTKTTDTFMIHGSYVRGASKPTIKHIGVAIEPKIVIRVSMIKPLFIKMTGRLIVEIHLD